MKAWEDETLCARVGQTPRCGGTMRWVLTTQISAAAAIRQNMKKNNPKCIMNANSLVGAVMKLQVMSAVWGKEGVTRTARQWCLGGAELNGLCTPVKEVHNHVLRKRYSCNAHTKGW